MWKRVFKKSAKYYVIASIILACAGILFGVIGTIFNFDKLFKKQAIDEKYCYFINNKGNIEKCTIGESEQDGKFIIQWYRDKKADTAQFIRAQSTYYLSKGKKVEILEYITKDSSLVKIRAGETIGYASSLTLHDSLP